MNQSKKWAAYVALGVLWLAAELAVQARNSALSDEPMRVQLAVLSAVVFVCVISFVGDVWIRYVRPNMAGAVLLALALTGARFIWSTSAAPPPRAVNIPPANAESAERGYEGPDDAKRTMPDPQ